MVLSICPYVCSVAKHGRAIAEVFERLDLLRFCSTPFVPAASSYKTYDIESEVLEVPCRFSTLQCFRNFMPHAHAHAHTHTHTRAHMHLHTRTHALARPHKRTRAHTYTHTRTHVLRSLRNRSTHVCEAMWQLRFEMTDSYLFCWMSRLTLEIYHSWALHIASLISETSLKCLQL